MRVLLLSNMYPSARNPGYGVFVHSHVERLESRYNVDFQLVVSTRSPRSFAERVTKYLDLPLRSSFAALGAIDLVHLHYASPAHLPAALPPILIKRRPLVVTLHGGDISMPPLSGAKRSMVAALLRRAGAVIAVSDEVKKMSASLGVSDDRLHVISMGCDLGLFRFVEHQHKAEIKRAIGAKAERSLVLFAGDLIPRKGCDLLLEAIAGDPELSAVEVAIAGDGPERSTLERIARSAALRDRVHWLGILRQRDLARWYAAADAFVFPTRQEPLGLVTLEAMASGTPVIAARTGGVPEVVKHLENGLLFEVDDAIGLRQSLRRVLDDEALRQKLVRAGRATAQSHALDRQVERVMQVYRLMLERPC
jgi:glycosyltransferase involved in cell wall biosynthesis